MASRQQNFVNSVYSQARAAGLPDAQARLAASQAALETGFGKSAVGNNYFGIKAGPSWTGPSVTAGTWEDVNGNRVNETARFRSYDDPLQSFQDWAGVVGRNWSASLAAPTFDEAVEGLNYGQPGGYATDRNYGDKLRSINSRFGPDIQELGIANGVPTPTARPDPYSSLLGDVQNNARPSNALLGYQPADVERATLAATPVSAFDNARFGPSPVNTQTLAATSPQPQSFDMGRFGPEVTSPTPSFDPGRFGTPTAPAQGVDGLRRGLLDQQLETGILPSTEYERLAQERRAVPGYVDPQVSARPAGTLLSDAPVQAPSRVSNGLLSPEAAAIQSAGGIVQARQPNYAIAAQLDKELGNRRMSGGLLGGLAGGALLGPLGAVVGGLLGRNYAQDTYFPSAPAPIAGRVDSPGYGYGRGGGSGYGSLSDYGRDVYSGSGQFSGAVDRGDVGLW